MLRSCSALAADTQDHTKSLRPHSPSPPTSHNGYLYRPYFIDEDSLGEVKSLAHEDRWSRGRAETQTHQCLNKLSHDHYWPLLKGGFICDLASPHPIPVPKMGRAVTVCDHRVIIPAPGLPRERAASPQGSQVGRGGAALQVVLGTPLPTTPPLGSSEGAQRSHFL